MIEANKDTNPGSTVKAVDGVKAPQEQPVTPPKDLPFSQSGDGVAPKTDQNCTLPAVVKEGSNLSLNKRMDIHINLSNEI